MPPQGLLVIAAYLPSHIGKCALSMRMSDPRREGFSMGRCRAGQRHAHPAPADERHQPPRPSVRQGYRAGWPSVSGCQDYYPDFDYLHVGELGDATDQLTEALARNLERPSEQQVLTTAARLPLSEFPTPRLSISLASQITFSPTSNSPAAAPTAVSSATFRALRPEPAPQNAGTNHPRV